MRMEAMSGQEEMAKIKLGSNVDIKRSDGKNKVISFNSCFYYSSQLRLLFGYVTIG